VVKDGLHNIYLEFAENRVIVVQAEVTHVNLDTLAFLLRTSHTTILASSPSELLADLKESFFDFTLNTRLKLLFHVVEL